MDRTQILSTMTELKLFGMKAAYDEIVAVALKRNHCRATNKMRVARQSG